MLIQHGFQFPHLAVKGNSGLKGFEDAATGDWGFERVCSPVRISVMVRMNGIVRIGIIARIFAMAGISIIARIFVMAGIGIIARIFIMDWMGVR